MKQTARLIIPVWGAIYAHKLVTITLPAAIAPGNLPSLCQMFDVEVVLVTETKLFQAIRASKSFQAVAKLCRTKLIPIDDLMIDTPGHYGPVLTYALYRGFQDLDERMTETYLLFLNADFIISDGSLRHLGKLMLEGRRVIHAPSFRAVLEEVLPRLEARVDPATSALAVSSREMAKLALDHRHMTVRARTVNQRLYHQRWMDQFYWQVDEQTLIGYQWPVALVAIRPEQVVVEPSLVWDYAFIPEAAPNLPRYFISDSDDFFMLEPQKRATGEDLVRPGGISVKDIVRDLNKWTTKEQRECGKELLIIHGGDLPVNLDAVVEESRQYMAQIFSRLDPKPQPLVGHALLGAWFEGVREHVRGRVNAAAKLISAGVGTGETDVALAVASLKPGATRRSLGVMRNIYEWTFGQPPEVRRQHPLWGDTHAVVASVKEWKKANAQILWLSSGDSLFHRMLKGRVDPMSLGLPQSELFGQRERYDACLCELTFGELTKLQEIYENIRPLMKDGAEIVVYVFNKNLRGIEAADTRFFEDALSDTDPSTVNLFGTRASAAVRQAYLSASNSSPGNPMQRALLTSAVLIGLAPVTWAVNRLASFRDPGIFSQPWTSLTMKFVVRRPASSMAQRTTGNAASG